MPILTHPLSKTPFHKGISEDLGRRLGVYAKFSLFQPHSTVSRVQTDSHGHGYDHVAEDRNLLTEVMRCVVNDEDHSESIIPELFEAMSQDIGFSDDEE